MKKLVTICSIFFLIIQFSCIKKNFIPNIKNIEDEQYLKQVNTTIAELRGCMPTDGSIYKIPNDANWVIQGVVVSSDRNGNFYKCIHIQDTTAGIQVLIDGLGLYTTYPVGMRIFIKLAGLGLLSYNNQIELGMVDNSSQTIINMPLRLSDNYIVKGSLNNSVDTLQISDITNLSSIHQSQLIKLSNVMIDTIAAGKQTMGDVLTQSSSYSISIEDSRKNTISLVTSPFASFANQFAPKGAGSLIAVVSQYRETIQLVISGMEDINFNPNDTVVFNKEVPKNWKIKKISELRSWKGKMNRFPLVGDTAIRGIVVSDNSFSNMPDSQLFIQDPEDNHRAICIFLNKKASDIKFKQGDEIVINLNGSVLTSQNVGKVIVSFSANHGAKEKDPSIVIVGSGKFITPVSINLDALMVDLATDNPKHESQLVKIENSYFGSMQGERFLGNIYLIQKDNIQQLLSYTKNSYTGKNLVPKGLCNVIALVAKYYGGYQFVFRIPTDVEDLHLDPPSVVNPPGCALYEDFDIRTGGVYAGTESTLNSGIWFIAGHCVMDANDRYAGTKSIRLRGNNSDASLGGNRIEMRFEKMDGVGYVKFKYGSYGSHSGGKIYVEYSIDSGNNWIRTASVFTAPKWEGNMLDAEVPINIGSSIRIRIKKDVQGGSTSVNIDNLCIGDYIPTAVAPKFNPEEGIYEEGKTITLSTVTPGATIYYTIDGSIPIIRSSNTLSYNSPISLNVGKSIIKAITVAPNMANSEVVSSGYTIIPIDMVSDPVFTPESGTYLNHLNVIISCATTNADIYYTIDGSTPTICSTKYTGPILVDKNTTIKAIAIKEANNSNIVFAEYKINPSLVPNIIISGVYGGGGNDRAIYKNDYIEIYNTTDTEIDISGYTLYYMSAKGINSTANNTYTFPSGSKIGTQKFALIKCASGTKGKDWEILFDYDASGPKGINMGISASEGKILLLDRYVNLQPTDSIFTNLLKIQTMPGYLDYMPFGTKTVPIFGTTTKNLSNNQAAKRKYDTFTKKILYTFNVGTDFELVPADDKAPRNSEY
ncbi:MAG: DUF5689 domain-containing protein [Chitinophagaceae bacterium]